MSAMVEESGRRPKVDPEAQGRGAAHDEHESFNSVVGEGIRRARQERGWTQASLAERARLSPNYVARLERGELGPSLIVAARICGALAIPIDGLVGPPSGVASDRKSAATKRRAG